MTGYSAPAQTPCARGRYEVVPDPLGWRVARNGCVTAPFHRRVDAVRLANRLQREADALSKRTAR
jgi:hypothetical protein